MKWILVFWLCWANACTSQSIEFDTHQACEKAQQAYLDATEKRAAWVSSMCIPKG